MKAVALALTFLACATAMPDDASMQRAPNTLTAQERAEGWRLLFDGRTTEGWRGYGRPDMPDGWQVVDGALTRVAQGGDIITTARFRDFELALEWMVEPGGNSGIFYRAPETSNPIYHDAPEMQVLDDAGHRDGQDPLTSAGSLYGLYAAPRGAVRPAGEWNQARVLVRDNHVEHWLNGQKVVEYELLSPEWEARVRAAKFRDWEGFGRSPQGHIGLQDHGDRVAFRTIRIREL